MGPLEIAIVYIIGYFLIFFSLLKVCFWLTEWFTPNVEDD